MKNTESLCLVVINILLGATSCTSYPTSLEKNFQLAGKNQSELKKVILHYSTHLTDSLKRKAVLFLIKNMDAHVSYANKSWDDFHRELGWLYCY